MDNIVIKNFDVVTSLNVNEIYDKVKHLIQNFDLPVDTSSKMLENLFGTNGYTIPYFNDIYNGAKYEYTLKDTKYLIIITKYEYKNEQIYLKAKELNIPIRIVRL